MASELAAHGLLDPAAFGLARRVAADAGMVFAIGVAKRRVYVHIVVSFRYGSSDRPATGQDGCPGCPGLIPHGGSSPVSKGLAPAVRELHISAI